MSIVQLQPYLPPDCLPHLQRWFGPHEIHLKVTRNRRSKLGDYRKMPDNSHQITINGTLQPHLFFFVLTHELAHLLAFAEFGHRIAAHGYEWKDRFRTMLLESLQVYSEDLQPIIKNFARAPKAGFLSSPELVRYFHIEDGRDETSYVEDLQPEDRFIYREETYLLETKRKKNYLCVNTGNGKKYIFKPLARVQKL